MLQRKLKTDILNGINNDSVIEVSWLYCTRHPQLFPFRESTRVCSRMFCLLAFRQTRPALQNLDLGFLKKKKRKIRLYALTTNCQNFGLKAFTQQHDSATAFGVFTSTRAIP